MYVCLCNAVTENAVIEARKRGARTLDDLQEQLGVATGCGQCAEVACAMLGSSPEDVVPNAPACCMNVPAKGLPRLA